MRKTKSTQIVQYIIPKVILDYEKIKLLAIHLLSYWYDIRVPLCNRGRTFEVCLYTEIKKNVTCRHCLKMMDWKELREQTIADRFKSSSLSKRSK